MTHQQNDKLIGVGIYTFHEAALYSGVTTQKLSRWLFGTPEHAPVIEPQLGPARIVSFVDLIQAMAIDRARAEGVPLQKIREAIQRARERYGVTLPLARKHRLMWFDRNLHIEFPNARVVQLTGKGRDQSMMKQIIEPFMKDLRFGDDGLAFRYIAFKSHGRKIVLDRERQFGQPLVGDTGYRADVLAQAFDAEQSVDSVAEAYSVKPDDVAAAVSYMKKLRDAA